MHSRLCPCTKQVRDPGSMLGCLTTHKHQLEVWLWTTKSVRVWLWDMNVKHERWENSGRKVHHSIKLHVPEIQAGSGLLAVRMGPFVSCWPPPLMAITALLVLCSSHRDHYSGPNACCVPSWLRIFSCEASSEPASPRSMSGPASRCFPNTVPLVAVITVVTEQLICEVCLSAGMEVP